MKQVALDRFALGNQEGSNRRRSRISPDDVDLKDGIRAKENYDLMANEKSVLMDPSEKDSPTERI